MHAGPDAGIVRDGVQQGPQPAPGRRVVAFPSVEVGILAAEAEQPGLVAIDDDVEGTRVSAADEGDQLFIPLELEQGRPPGKEPAARGMTEC